MSNTTDSNYKFEHESINGESSSEHVVVIPNNEHQDQSHPSTNGVNTNWMISSMNNSPANQVIVNRCQGCFAKEKEIEELKRKLKLVIEDRNNQIKLNYNLLNENIESEKKYSSSNIPEPIQYVSASSHPSANQNTSNNHVPVTITSPSMAHLPVGMTYMAGTSYSSDNITSSVMSSPANEIKHRSIDYNYVQDERLVEILPKTGVYCSAVTRETGKAQPDAGHAICYLFKRFFTMDELADSSLGAHSKNGFKQLPTKIVQAIKAFVICNFTQKDGQKIGVTLLNHTINSLCGQARILKKRGKKWKVKAEKEEYNER